MSYRLLSLVFASSLFITACGGAAVPSDAQSSAQKVVESFYGMVDEDPAGALSLVAPDAQSEVQESVNSMQEEGWDFQNVEVVSVEGNFVKVSMEIMIEGEVDSGTDDVEVVEQDGKWWIVSIPS